MKLTVMIQRRWWSAVTKISKIRTKNKCPGVMLIYITTQMKNTKIWKCPGVRILCGLPRRDQDRPEGTRKHGGTLKKCVVQIVHSHNLMGWRMYFNCCAREMTKCVCVNWSFSSHSPSRVCPSGCSCLFLLVLVTPDLTSYWILVTNQPSCLVDSYMSM